MYAEGRATGEGQDVLVRLLEIASSKGVADRLQARTKLRYVQLSCTFSTLYLPVLNYIQSNSTRWTREHEKSTLTYEEGYTHTHRTHVYYATKSYHQIPVVPGTITLVQVVPSTTARLTTSVYTHSEAAQLLPSCRSAIAVGQSVMGGQHRGTRDHVVQGKGAGLFILCENVQLSCTTFTWLGVKLSTDFVNTRPYLMGFSMFLAG